MEKEDGEKAKHVNFYRNIMFSTLISTEAKTLTVSRISIAWFKSYKEENRDHESSEHSICRGQLLKDYATE
jgi:hypothetical protein